MNADEIWLGLLRQLLERGHHASPRGMGVLELLGVQSQWPMSNPLILLADRKLGYRFAAAEAAWILSGDNRVSTIKPYSKKISEFSDDGIRFFGAYGPKVVDQLPFVVSTLLRDPESRQAVINIWREKPPQDTRDVPCTLSLQFLIRDRRMHCISTMRSNDVWLGTPYDVHNFSQIAAAVIISLREAGRRTALRLGTLYHNVGSLHLYQSMTDRVTGILAKEYHQSIDDPTIVPLATTAFGSVDSQLKYLWAMARRP